MAKTFLNDAPLQRGIPRTTLFHDDCLLRLPQLPAESIDACVTDPPYGLKFMGKQWDHGIPGVPYWREVFRVLKPGAYLLAFGGTRTIHRLTCAIEDAGFEIRDQIAWVYGSGFPKSLDVSKAIDKAAGAERHGERLGAASCKWIENGEKCQGHTNGVLQPTFHVGKSDPATDAARQWAGWGTALKPAMELICVARKPLVGTVAANVLEHGTGALNIDGCRVDYQGAADQASAIPGGRITTRGGKYTAGTTEPNSAELNREEWASKMKGRWPANLIHDGSDEVATLLPMSRDGVAIQRNRDGQVHNVVYGAYQKPAQQDVGYGGSGSAARFFYCAKASRSERGLDNTHPTVKPLALMRYLVRLVTPPSGLVLDLFLGSGTTGVACMDEGFRILGIERDEGSFTTARDRIITARRGPRWIRG